MNAIKVTAISCGAIDYKDNDKLVTLCSVELGKITAVLKGCRKANAKLKFAAAPFCFGEYILSEKNGYYTVTGCTPIEQFIAISSDIERFYAGSVMIEALRTSAKEGDNIAPLVATVLEGLKTLCYEEVSVGIIVVDFLLKLFKKAGYGLNFNGCSVCRSTQFVKKYFSLSQGGLVCPICCGSGAKLISGESLGLLRSLSTGVPVGVLRFEESVQRECLVLLGETFAEITGRKINSLIQYMNIQKSV